jgi:hypothetical protein
LILFSFRQVDANNHWYLNMGQTWNVSLVENVAGTPTGRGSAGGGAIANGQAAAAGLSLAMITTTIEALLVGKPVSFKGEGEDSSIGSRLP